MTIKEILNNLYPEEDALHAESLLIEFEIYEHFKSCLNTIKEKLVNEVEEKDKYGSLQIGAVTACLLSGVNEKLRCFGNKKNKNQVQGIAADVSNSIFQYTIKNSQTDPGILIKQVAISLHDTCTVFKYDEAELQKLFNFKEKEDLAELILNKERVILTTNPKDIRYYKWSGNPKKKQIFISIFFDRNLVVSKCKKDFFKLFDPLGVKLSLELEPVNINLTIALFHHLYIKGLLKSSGDGGFYKPLRQHILGFETSVLINKTPGELIDKLKKSTHEWRTNTNKIEKWLQEIK